MGRYTLWCLNRVATWDRRRLARALSVPGAWFSSRHDVRLGRRGWCDRDPAWEVRWGDPEQHGGILMHEDWSCDEYFVPIAVKCIGDPEGFRARFGPRMTAAGRARFDALVAAHAGLFAHGEFRAYWHPFAVADPLRDVGMFTRVDGERSYAGLYELVAADARASGTRAVLVGYSQGGLVARFLAWMDELLMAEAERSIAGFVTVQAPNHGSPLANRRNADAVSVGLLGIATGLGGLPIVQGQHAPVRQLLESVAAGSPPRPWHFGVGAIADYLDVAIADLSPSTDPATLRKENLLRTARKWLTGLLPTAVPTAFGDLDPANLDRPGTVLGSLADLPIERTPHAAIVGADTRVDDLAVSERNLVGRFILRHAVPARWFAAVQDPYATIALDELSAGQPLSPRQSAVARRYREGLRVAAPTQDADLAPFAHDFVIPSASQALHVLAPPPPEVFLGNAINARATHVSGAEERGCDSDAPAVRRMLRAIGRLLP